MSLCFSQFIDGLSASARQRRQWCLTLALGVLAVAASAHIAAAQELVGTWNCNGYLVTVTDIGGRVHFRYRGKLYARGWQSGSRLELMHENEGQRVAWNGTLQKREGQPDRIQMDDGSLYQRWPVDAGASVDLGAPLPAALTPRNIAPAAASPLPSPTVDPTPQPQAPLPQDAGYSLAGEWSSNLGLRYRITQTGDTFAWTIDGLPQVGRGTISGAAVSANWRGALSSGNVSGTVVIGPSGPERIEFNNGVVLTR